MSFEKAIISVLLLIFGFFAFMLFVSVPFNNYKLFVIRQQFEKLQSQDLAQSRLLARKSEVDHWGNSNLCDYYVGQFRASSFSKEEIEKAYEGLKINSFLGDKNAPLDIELFTEQEDWMGPYYWEELWEELEVKLNQDENLYLVFVSSDSHSASGDLRCH